LGTLNWVFEDVFENLGIVPYSNEMFSEMRFWMEEKELVDFMKKALGFFVVVQNN
jgi:hypothetical protein